jgi:hypothetical protein
VKGGKTILQANRIQKQAGMAIYISDKAALKPKLVKRDKEDHYILMKGIKHQEVIIIFPTHALNIGGPNFIKSILLDLKRQLGTSTIIVSDVNTPKKSTKKLQSYTASQDKWT